jgi:cytochrome c oxidase assembly protein Cox11
VAGSFLKLKDSVLYSRERFVVFIMIIIMIYASVYVHLCQLRRYKTLVLSNKNTRTAKQMIKISAMVS